MASRENLQYLTAQQSREELAVTAATKANLVNTDEKPKHMEFPLDHILPVFNLSKKDSSFIPTLKIR